MSLTDRYRRWYEYEKDCNAKVLASFAAVDPALRAEPRYQKALDLLAHMVLARWLWLSRFGVETPAIPTEPSGFFPEGVALAELETRVAAVETAWTSYLAKLDEAELARVFEYRSLDGRRHRNTIEDILTQLFGHAWYHRGQIAQHVRAIGADPAVTDFVFWSRETLPL